MEIVLLNELFKQIALQMRHQEWKEEKHVTT